MDKIVSTVLGVVIAIGGSAALFIGANKWFDQAKVSWNRFGAITGGILGFSVSAIMVGNRAMSWKTSTAEDATDLSLILPVLFAALGAGMGFLLTNTEDRTRRIAYGAGSGVVLALVAGAFIRPDAYPAMRIVPLLLWPVVGAAVFAGLAAIRKTDLVKGVVTGGFLGWIAGAWLEPSLGGGTVAEAITGLAVAGGLFGLRLGLNAPADYGRRERVQTGSRAVIFLTPALLFIAATLIIPTVQTLILSFQDTRGEEWVGGKNYADIFTNPDIFNVSNFGGIFTNGLFIWGILLAILGIGLARWKGRELGGGNDWTGLTVTPLAIGGTLVAFAVFITLRGVIWNNLWWVFSVTVLSTSFGLAIAVLADRAKGEAIAKSLIFMPMAISFVGAGIIWRFMYLPRPPSKPQTGVLNWMWVGLGKLSVEGGTGRLVLTAILLAIAAVLLFFAYRGWRAEENGVVLGSLVTVAPIAWFLYRLYGPGIGGFARAEDGSPLLDAGGNVVAEAVLFLQEQPWNTFWLIIVLIWIQTGFAMVVLSAAIKGVPTDLIEASKVDGATESQTFWRVVVPQIASTIGVVVTTLIVLVMKVFDIPKVMTNGQFGTNVIANEMWQKAFTELNIGAGAALAMVLFFSVLPVMYINIRRQREAV